MKRTKKRFRKFYGRMLRIWATCGWFESYKLSPREVFLVDEWIEKHGLPF